MSRIMIVAHSYETIVQLDYYMINSVGVQIGLEYTWFWTECSQAFPGFSLIFMTTNVIKILVIGQIYFSVFSPSESRKVIYVVTL
jgi:hypothetical protein